MNVKKIFVWLENETRFTMEQAFQMSQNLPVPNSEIGTGVPKHLQIETPRDIQALQALSLWGKRLPYRLIAQQMGVPQTTAWRLVQRGKLPAGMDENDVVPKAIVTMDELIRASYAEVTEIEKDASLTPIQKIKILQSIRNQVQSFVGTQLQANRQGQPNLQQTDRVTPTGQGVVYEHTQTFRGPLELLEEMRQKGLIHPTVKFRDADGKEYSEEEWKAKQAKEQEKKTS